MAELILTNTVNTSIATPGAGISSIFVDTDGKLKYKQPTTGTVVLAMPSTALTTATAGGTTTMTNTSESLQRWTGTLTQIIKLPDATTIQAGVRYVIDNDSTGIITLQDGNAGALLTIAPGCSSFATLVTAGSVAGTWDTLPIGFWADPTDQTKRIIYISSGASTSTALTIADAQTTSQTLNIPNITGSSILITDTLAQTISGIKTFSAVPVLTGALPAFSKVNNITTAGTGVPIVYASAAVGSVSSTQTNLINYTPPAVAGRYRLSYYISNTSGTNTGTTTPNFTFTDAGGIAKSYNIPMAQEGSVTWLLAATAASKSFHGSIVFSINNAATAITATFTIAGTVATFISATLEQLG